MSGKRVALMQPYFLPYLGYWQMMKSVDVFIVYDTVQFTRGWMNRNRYRLGDGARWMTLPVMKGDLEDLIPERLLAENFPSVRDNILRNLSAAYVEAPFKERGLQLVSSVLDTGAAGEPLIDLLMEGLEAVRDLLEIETLLVMASELPHDKTLGRADRVIALTQAAGGETYYSLSGAKELYDPDYFAEKNLDIVFRDFNEETEGGVGDRALSIVDLVMRYDLPTLQEMLADGQWGFSTGRFAARHRLLPRR